MFICSVQSCRNSDVNRQHVHAWFHFIFLDHQCSLCEEHHFICKISELLHQRCEEIMVTCLEAEAGGPGGQRWLESTIQTSDGCNGRLKLPKFLADAYGHINFSSTVTIITTISLFFFLKIAQSDNEYWLASCRVLAISSWGLNRHWMWAKRNYLLLPWFRKSICL
jgi:hypothetical protein